MDAAQNFFGIPPFNVIINGQTFSDHEKLNSQCLIWTNTLDEDAFRYLLAEAGDAVSEWLDNGREVTDRGCAAFYNRAIRIAPEFATSEESRWKKMAQVAARYAEYQANHADILQQVTDAWQENGREILRLKAALWWKRLARDLAQPVPGYRQAMNFLSHAIYHRRLNVCIGLRCDLIPKGIDPVCAVKLAENFPTLPQLTDEDLEIGEPDYFLQISETGLLEYGKQSDAD